jgi:xylulokinase
MATYEGAIMGLLDALDIIDSCSSGVDPAAPLVLIGGGARGEAWQHVIRQLSGRAVSVPDATELVAIGAAVQAAATQSGEAPQEVAARWRTDRGTLFDPLPRDDATIARHREVRRLALAAVGGAQGAR